MSTSAAPGDIFAALFAAHQVGDYWLQTGRQAADKGHPDRPGQFACARHVATMTVTKTAALGVLHATGRRVDWRRAAVALAADAASHYWADRRVPLRCVADRLGATVVNGKGEFYAFGANPDSPCMGTGAALLDQAWHVAWLWIAATTAAGRPASEPQGE